ncbi:MAG: RES family NAD+ phosphorylase [Proteobacteria bacterium]|nr:RES family NAD+ phosphorylase [Pseudomonadota bacterium]
MSSHTWTPAALSSEARAYDGKVWRLVEAQHRVSTMKLVDDIDEQAVLERLVEATKPVVPPECRHLDYLLATPFRYGAIYPTGSRFRRAGRTPGVFYAAENPETAVAEMAFYRLLFFAESPDTPWPSNAAEYTAFSTAIRTPFAIDLMQPPLDRDAARWTHPTDYSDCQNLAEVARGAKVEAIRYRSVRDPEARANLAVLTCAAFAVAEPLDRQTWRIRLSASGVQALREFPEERLGFAREAFTGDPRLAGMVWERRRPRQ